MIKNLTLKPLGKDMTYREGQVYCKLWDTEIDVALYDELDGKLVYLSEYAGQSPWDDHSDEEWNYAAHIYER